MCVEEAYITIGKITPKKFLAINSNEFTHPVSILE